MNSAGREFCRFCLKIIRGHNFDIIGDTTLEILNVLSIKMDLGADREFLMCRDCQVAIEKCVNFKSMCICSEDSIAGYISEDSNLDLEDIYFKKLRQRSTRTPKGHKICRLCMKITTKYLNSTDEFFALTNDKLQKFIPELNLSIVKQPVICETCLVALLSYCEFVANCLDVEGKINRYCEARSIDKRQVELYNVLQFMLNKTVESDISTSVIPRRVEKLYEDQDIVINCTELGAIEFDIKTKNVEVASEKDNKGSKKIYEKSKTGLINGGQVQFTEADKCIQNGDINCDKAFDLNSEETQTMVSLPGIINGQDADENQSQLSEQHNFIESSIVQMYIKNEEINIKPEYVKCDTKNYESQENNLQNDRPYKKKHSTNSQIKGQSFCEICSTYYYDKVVLANHKSRIHGVGLQLIYNCDQCSFVTKHRESLSNHRKMHKSLSELKMHKCKECQYKTKYIGNLKVHEMAHKSNAQIYNCGVCAYTTKYKPHLKLHHLTHKDKSELVTYDCFHCPYKAKRKSYLSDHISRKHTKPHVGS